VRRGGRSGEAGARGTRSSAWEGPTWRALRAGVASGCGISIPPVADGPIDWGRFCELVERHRVGAVIHGSAWARDVDAPRDVVDRLAADAREATLGSLRLLTLQREALQALQGAKIDVVVVKGAPLAQEAYGVVAGRHAGDLDLLVAPERVVEAVRVLREHGFQWYGIDAPQELRPPDGGLALLARAGDLPLVKEAQLYRAGHHVDVHWRLTVNAALLPLEHRWLTTPRLVKSASVLTPVLPVLPAWWHVLVHGAEHDWRRLKWLADVPAFAAAHPEVLSPGALQATSRAGLGRCVACGLLVAERLLGSFLPAPAAKWVVSTRGVDRLVDRFMEGVAHDEPIRGALRATQVAGHVRTRMALRTGMGYRRAEARNLLLAAGRSGLEPEPRLRSLVKGPPRWLARTSRPRP
jgi:hypothetical protein